MELGCSRVVGGAMLHVPALPAHIQTHTDARAHTHTQDTREDISKPYT